MILACPPQLCAVCNRPITKKHILDCCPDKKANDRVCVLLHYMDTSSLSMNPGCTCGEIKRSCNQIELYHRLVDNLGGMCNQTHVCCNRGRTTNDEVVEYINAVDLEVPDFGMLISGG